LNYIAEHTNTKLGTDIVKLNNMTDFAIENPGKIKAGLIFCTDFIPFNETFNLPCKFPNIKKE